MPNFPKREDESAYDHPPRMPGVPKPGRIERYLEHLDALSGGIEPRFDPVPARDGKWHIWCITYEDLPEPGYTTALTYGLSLAHHPNWTHARPELITTVKTPHGFPWGFAAAHLAEDLQGDCPFEYGNTLGFRQLIGPHSQMDAFTVFRPSALDPVDACFDVGDDLPIHLRGMYPIHPSERAFILEHGPQAFWDTPGDWDQDDVTRAPIR